jgi:hypothetical protein
MPPLGKDRDFGRPLLRRSYIVSLCKMIVRPVCAGRARGVIIVNQSAVNIIRAKGAEAAIRRRQWQKEKLTMGELSVSLKEMFEREYFQGELEGRLWAFLSPAARGRALDAAAEALLAVLDDGGLPWNELHGVDRPDPEPSFEWPDKDKRKHRRFCKRWMKAHRAIGAAERIFF